MVELVRQPGNTAGSVARDLNLTETAVRAWAKQADLDQGRRSDGLTSEQLSEMAQLRKELREAREEPAPQCTSPRPNARRGRAHRRIKADTPVTSPFRNASRVP